MPEPDFICVNDYILVSNGQYADVFLVTSFETPTDSDGTNDLIIHAQEGNPQNLPSIHARQADWVSGGYGTSLNEVLNSYKKTKTTISKLLIERYFEDPNIPGVLLKEDYSRYNIDYATTREIVTRNLDTFQVALGVSTNAVKTPTPIPNSGDEFDDHGNLLQEWGPRHQVYYPLASPGSTGTDWVTGLNQIWTLTKSIQIFLVLVDDTPDHLIQSTFMHSENEVALDSEHFCTEGSMLCLGDYVLGSTQDEYKRYLFWKYIDLWNTGFGDRYAPSLQEILRERPGAAVKCPSPTDP
jgi:hypothetical protein